MKVSSLDYSPMNGTNGTPIECVRPWSTRALMSASKSRGTATIASHRSTAPANLLSSAASELERHRGAPKLRAAAALFSLGSKGRYVAAKSGGKVTANGRVYQLRQSPRDLLACPAALLLLQRRRGLDPVIRKLHRCPAITTPLLVQATQARK